MNSGLFYDRCKKGGSVYAHSRASTFFFHKEHAWLSPAVLQELKWRLLQKLRERDCNETVPERCGCGSGACSERRSFIISHSSHLPPLSVLQLLVSWWPGIDSSKLATLRSPKVAPTSCRVCFSEARWHLSFQMTLRLCEPCWSHDRGWLCTHEELVKITGNRVINLTLKYSEDSKRWLLPQRVKRVQAGRFGSVCCCNVLPVTVWVYAVLRFGLAKCFSGFETLTFVFLAGFWLVQ